MPGFRGTKKADYLVKAATTKGTNMDRLLTASDIISQIKEVWKEFYEASLRVKRNFYESIHPFIPHKRVV